MNVNQLLVLLCMGLLTMSIEGCGPRYVTTKNYLPPMSSAGMKCKYDADYAKLQCEKTSKEKFDVCRKEAEREAHYHYEGAMREYHWAEREFQRCRANSEDGSSCPRLPQPPRFENFVNLRPCGQEVSYQEAKCGEEYDILYQRCGGVVQSETRCVSRCDKEKK